MKIFAFRKRAGALGVPSLAALGLWLGLTPAFADEAPLLMPRDYAPAVLRQDLVPGAYELVHVAELGAVFVASVAALTPEGGGAIHMLDDADLRPLRRIQLQRGAFALCYDRVRERLHAGNTLDGSVTVIDVASGVVVNVTDLGRRNEDGRAEHTRMVEISPDASRVFVSSPGREGIVWVVDTASGDVIHRIEKTGLWTAGFAFDPVSGRLYASGGGTEEIAVIDPESGIRLGGLSTGDTTDPDPQASRHFFVNLSIDPEAGRLYAADASSGEVTIFDVAGGKTVGRIPVGKGLLDVLFNPQRQEIYASWRGVGEGDTAGNGGLAVIDARSHEVKARLEVPVHPNSLALSGDGAVLYMTAKMPLDNKHISWREGATDSVLRIDLTRLESLYPE